MAKLILVGVCVAIVGVLAEPPSSYAPPQARNSLSSLYGAPQSRSGGFNGQRSSGGRSYSYNSLADNQFGGSRRNGNNGRFGGSHQQPSQQYGAPGRQQSPQQFNSYSNGIDDSVVTNSARFGQSRNGHGQNNFGASRGFGYQQPSQQYSAPAARQQQPSYSAPRQSSYSAPQQQYGAPSNEYGAPFGRSKMDDDLAEPANYEYNYEVQAAEESGAEFGHQETREDDRAQGEYHVLLPDGRMQIVEYEADEEGFRPRIRYEETGYPDSRNNQGGPY